MDSLSLDRAWIQICDRIRTYPGVDPNQLTAFFSRLHPQAMSEGFLMLTAENEFLKGWIEKNYLPLILQALTDIYGVTFSVLIEVDTFSGNESEESIVKAADQGRVIPQAAVPVPFNQGGILHDEAEPPAETLSVEDSVVTPSSKSEDANSTDYFRDDSDDLPVHKLTFANFVMGESNRMAYSMAVSVAEAPGKSILNPLFIYGKSGLGKTHLMRAIQNYISDNLPNLKVIYIDSAELLSDYMEASASHDKDKSSYKNFKDRYIEADVLLIDDVQYLQGKKQTLEIVFQILKVLSDRGKQIVLSADRAPKNIDIDERLHSRFNEGGTIDIQPPEIETKVRIVYSLLEEYRRNENLNDFGLSDEVIYYIAENSSSNIRELKSAVTKVIYQMRMTGMESISLSEVRILLENHFSGGSSKNLSIDQIQGVVEDFFKVKHTDLIGSKRARNIVYPRHIAIYLCRQMLDLPYSYIGKSFNRDHSTTMHSVKAIEELLKSSRDVREEIEILTKMIREL